jgi:hypothetical protein
MVIQEGKGRDEVIDKVKEFKRVLSAQDSVGLKVHLKA